MPRSTSDFRINTAARAYRAAVKAGMRNPRIEISLPNGTTIKVSEQPESTPAAQAGPNANTPAAREIVL